MGEIDRRGFIRLAGLGGGIVFASSLGLNTLGSVLDYANGSAGKKVEKDFYFAQLSDTHWGFSGPKVNRDAKGTLKRYRLSIASRNNRISWFLLATFISFDSGSGFD